MHARLCIVNSQVATSIKVQHRDVIHVDYAVADDGTVETDNTHDNASTRVFKFGAGSYGVLRFAYGPTEPFTVTVEGDDQALVEQVRSEDIGVMRKTDAHELVRGHILAINQFDYPAAELT